MICLYLCVCRKEHCSALAAKTLQLELFKYSIHLGKIFQIDWEKMHIVN